MLRSRGERDPRDNVPYNRELWDWYADNWRRDPRFRREQADVERDPTTGSARFSILGDEWGTAADLSRVVTGYIDPFVDEHSVVGEIGSGGGRLAGQVVDKVAELYCFDISRKMLDRARHALQRHSNVQYMLLDDARLPPELAGRLDFVYAFDVFVHLDLHTIWRYLQEIATALRPGGHTFLHTTNLTAPGGWESFARQKAYRPETHYFISPEIVRTLVGHTDLRFVKESAPDASSFYLNRDFLFVLKKPSGRCDA